ncbi:rhamnan synthesis F family protein [Ornithinimicrobium sp. W1679]|uniref:rhamnan synthesis F family protein n=1 Tax=Ornithinimicrobium sp. W1679 TaxID=3418770 RepID=UPI003CEEEB61
MVSGGVGRSRGEALKSRARRTLPKPAVILLRRVIDVCGGVIDELRWGRIRGEIAGAQLSGEGLVVVHIYYADTWPDIAAKLLQCIPEAPVIVTTSGPVASRDVKAVMPQAHVYRVPNRGRDVLPFLQVVRVLEGSNVEWFLKLHGKKSRHHRFGDEWMTSTLDALLPSASVARACLDRLAEGVPLVGPRGFFYDLRTHLEPNRTRLEALTGSVDDKKLGFFGGTMWWIRRDSLTSLPRWRSWDFPKERGQTDGTTAHIFERLVCVAPQLAGSHLASVDGDGVRTMMSFDPFPYDKL